MSYTKDCDNCNEKILMQQVNGKWGAYDPSGTSWHKWSKNKNGNSSNGGQVQQETQTKLEERFDALDKRVSRLQRIIDNLLNAAIFSEA